MRLLRSKPAAERFGVGKTAFFENYVWHPGGPEFVKGTTAVPRLKPVLISEKVSGFADVEIDRVIQGILDERDAGLLMRPGIRNAAGQFITNEEKEATA